MLLTIAKADYDEIIWPAAAHRGMSPDDDPALAEGLLMKLEALGAPGESADDDLFAMVEESAELELTDREAALLLTRLDDERRRHTTLRMRALFPAMESLQAAADRVTQAARDAARTPALGSVEAALAERRAELTEVDQAIASREAAVTEVEDALITLRARLEEVLGDIDRSRANRGGAR